jgi:single-strand DNA-binding protein
MYLNNVQLIGFVGNNAELKSSREGSEFVRFNLATKQFWKTNNGEYESTTQWHKVVVWNGLSKFARQLKKGDHVLVEGELRHREYAKEVTVGSESTTVTIQLSEIVARSIRRLDRKEAHASETEPEGLDKTTSSTDDISA